MTELTLSVRGETFRAQFIPHNGRVKPAPIILKTRSEQRLEQLEALQRPLTKNESNELRRCLHAIYVRNKRLERSVAGITYDDLEVQKAATLETGPIANRMVMASDDCWPEPKPSGDDWIDQARNASYALCEAIHRAGVRP